MSDFQGWYEGYSPEILILVKLGSPPSDYRANQVRSALEVFDDSVRRANIEVTPLSKYSEAFVVPVLNRYLPRNIQKKRSAIQICNLVDYNLVGNDNVFPDPIQSRTHFNVQQTHQEMHHRYQHNSTKMAM